MTNLSGKQAWTLTGATRKPHPDLVPAATAFHADRQSAKAISHKDVLVNDEFQPIKGSRLIGGVITHINGSIAHYDYHYMGKWHQAIAPFRLTALKGGYIRRDAEFMLVI